MRTHIAASRVVVRISASNPRKQGTQGYEAWEQAWVGGRAEMTYGEYAAAVKTKISARDHFGWDRAHGWVRFADETPEQATAGAPKPVAATPAAPAPVPTLAEAKALVARLEAEAEAAALEAAQAAKLAEVEATLEADGRMTLAECEDLTHKELKRLAKAA